MQSSLEKILSIINEKHLGVLLFDRNYLLEIINKSLCIVYEMPEFKPEFELFLKNNGININKEGNSIKFTLQKERI
ncbi:MAG: hypothetical protein JW891_08565 [Candidatus Lokiarchaeota archaeon]|nr:hypothetical protein [Candidatus Lokiarchaeota archaeon]